MPLVADARHKLAGQRVGKEADVFVEDQKAERLRARGAEALGGAVGVVAELSQRRLDSLPRR
jgi:hypothetical protein